MSALQRCELNAQHDSREMSDTYRDLIAWQRAMALVTQVDVATEAFPQR